MSQRIWQLDFVKGIAIIAVIIANYSFALYYFGIIEQTENWFYWWLFPRMAAGTFVVVSGISLWLSYLKNQTLTKQAKRSMILLLIAAVVTLATYFAINTDYVLFGIMHFMALSGLVGYFVLKLNPKISHLILGGITLMFAGLFVQMVDGQNYFFMWLGFVPYEYHAVDYFPLMPWFGLTMIGIAIGKTIFSRGAGVSITDKLRNEKRNRAIESFCLIGRNTLAAYMLHIPVLFAVIYLIKILTGQ